MGRLIVTDRGHGRGRGRGIVRGRGTGRGIARGQDLAIVDDPTTDAMRGRDLDRGIGAGRGVVVAIRRQDLDRLTIAPHPHPTFVRPAASLPLLLLIALHLPYIILVHLSHRLQSPCPSSASPNGTNLSTTPSTTEASQRRRQRCDERTNSSRLWTATCRCWTDRRPQQRWSYEKNPSSPSSLRPPTSDPAYKLA